jgi:hypothetical protein
MCRLTRDLTERKEADEALRDAQRMVSRDAVLEVHECQHHRPAAAVDRRIYATSSEDGSTISADSSDRAMPTQSGRSSSHYYGR